MDTGFMFSFIGLLVAAIGAIVKVAMDYQKVKGGLETLNAKVCDHIERNDGEHKELFAIKDSLYELKSDVKVIIDRLTRRKEDTHEAQ